MTTDELKKKYADAEVKITEIYTDTRAATVTSYQAKTKKKTEKVFEDLRKSTTKYCDTEIQRIYEDSLEQIEFGLDEDFGAEEDWHFDKVKESETIDNAKADTESKLLFALIMAGISLSNYNAKAQMEIGFGDVNEFKNAIIMQLAENGIDGGAYFRDGVIVNTRLASYADEVLQGVDTMVGNDAVMDTMMANGWDLVKMSEHDDSCPICLPYQGRVYSVSGNSDEYPSLYDTGWSETFQNFHPNCRHYLTPYFPQFSDNVEEMKEYSNRSFDVGGKGWTKAQTEKAQHNLKLYEQGQKRKAEIRNAQQQYEKYKAALGDKAPKTFQGFWRIKQADGESYAELKSLFRQREAL